MNPENALTVFGETICGILEKTAFLFADPIEKPEACIPEENTLRATMSFAGPHCGTVGITVSTATCTEMAENVLGIDSTDDGIDEKAKDALKEVLNIVCGQFLLDFAGEDPVFTLTIPSVENVTPEQYQGILRQDATLAFELDDETMLATLEMREDDQ